MPTRSEENQAIVEHYRAAGQPWPATARQIAEWAVNRGQWRPHPALLVNQAAEELARAMREEYIRDPQGRTVRAKHAARMDSAGEQAVFWADIRTASREHMHIAFQQRRQQIVGDCHALKVDVDSFNTNRSSDQPIQMIFDFTNDLDELEAAG